MEGNKSPLVSVCIPAFNASAYLKETVSSVQNQTMKDLEIIIVDDGSTDNTLELATSLARFDRRIRIFSQINSGSCAARNLAFTKSCGKYVALLDSDDLWPSYKISEQVKVLNNNPKAIVIGATQRFQVDQENLFYSFGLKTTPFDYSSRKDYLTKLLNAQPQEMVLINNFLAPREFVLEDLWNPDFKTGHDWEAWIRLAKKHQFIHSKNIYQYYRKHDNSSTKSNNISVPISCHSRIIKKHGFEITGSKKGLNFAFANRMLGLANDALYGDNIGSAIFCLISSLRSGYTLKRRSFYRLSFRSAKLGLKKLKLL